MKTSHLGPITMVNVILFDTFFCNLIHNQNCLGHPSSLFRVENVKAGLLLYSTAEVLSLQSYPQHMFIVSSGETGCTTTDKHNYQLLHHESLLCV